MSKVNGIPKGWVITTLGNICKPKGGKRLPKGETLISERTDHPYIRITDFEGNSINKSNLQFVPDETFKKISRYIVNEGDVIISIVGTIGLVALIDKKLNNASLTENCVKLIKPKGVYNLFLYYYLTSKHGQYEIDINTVGAVQKKLPIYGVENINIFLPPLPEQKAIANILKAFDDKIENLQTQNKTLEQTAQTIFKEWFGKYQVGDELPEGWRVGRIGDYITDSIGGDYGKEEPQDDYEIETICLRGTDLPDMKMGVPEKAPVRFLKKSKIDKCKLLNGDIVIEISGGTENQSTGRVAYINEQILNQSNLLMTCVNFCRILRPKNPENSYFIYSLFEYLYSEIIGLLYFFFTALNTLIAVRLLINSCFSFSNVFKICIAFTSCLGLKLSTIF